MLDIQGPGALLPHPELQHVFRKGSRLTRVGDRDDQPTETDAYDLPEPGYVDNSFKPTPQSGAA
jgi:hypothetical protein